jgi:hypothetical protein
MAANGIEKVLLRWLLAAGQQSLDIGGSLLQLLKSTIYLLPKP